jgi:glycosyltransferase involved in cell wall biosynthesis
VVPYGIDGSPFEKVAPRTCDGRPRIFAIGSDADREWQVLVDLAKACPDMDFLLVVPDRSLAPAALPWNVVLTTSPGSREVVASYEWCDAVMLPLRPNRHASGLTVALEAAAAGRPVVATKTVGLAEYFPGDEIAFLPYGSSADDWRKVLQAAVEPHNAARHVEKMRQRVHAAGYTAAD